MKNSHHLYKMILGGILSLLGIVIISCTDDFDSDTFKTDVSVHINSFVVNNIPAAIDHTGDKITAQMPYGTNVTALMPQIQIPTGATVTPAQGTAVDFTNDVTYRVKNGNIYKDYRVSIKAQYPILSFTINGLNAVINHTNKTISLTVPKNTDLTALKPEIVTAEGVSVSPASKTVLDFTNPVQFTVSNSLKTEVYTAKVALPVTGPKVAFLGLAETSSQISNEDEKAAYNWLKQTFTNTSYVSFKSLATGAGLSDYDVVWWHYDSAASLPADALNQSAVNIIKNYLNNGGNILLTTFASMYTEALGIVPPGKGPNNVFGDFLPNGFVDSSDWGISFRGHENHPIFDGLETFDSGKAYLLAKGTFRLNHTAWWFVPEWGGYGDGAGWRKQTGGINLASEPWDDNLNGRVTVAEFKNSSDNTNCVIISTGAYDWYNETSNGTPSTPNTYLDNIKRMTLNSINYLNNH